ncbi:diol dehydratase reactivase subunit alpha [Ilyobacter polytropus]|uniref:Glycerol dehydratase reactivation factor, large subunit n=1 Tax=Ilyobacter polytropus (strain ATCC 51220 / DSM 2926 / LMG 16218 / CuHBu1) TaxID=572544 RepID=E3HDB0_ILYPC|nr:diol dehydratase reactivase subunit alpha [Ilyobacter polytropus]ADO84110.1 glycerol dehydratase reactivation factor, large subunit [Ilyobacter polytropus DSM 2926]
MKLIVGIDIGNATTESTLAQVDGEKVQVLSSGIVKTTGIKGTKENIKGVFKSLQKALENCGKTLEEVSLIRINEAAPVIGDVAMETITETIITESTMIGHNPSTPGGIGIGVGISLPIEDIKKDHVGVEVIALINKDVDFQVAARTINNLVKMGVNITGAIVQKDDAVLINNRLDRKIPIIDEVLHIEKVPVNMKTAIEVSEKGKVISMLSNPYGIATLFDLTPEETKMIMPLSRALIGNRSAVVIKTPKGDVKSKIIPAGELNITGESKKRSVRVDRGSKEIMSAIKACHPVNDIYGETGTNAGGMLEKVRVVMAQLTDQNVKNIKIQDLLAVDTFVPQKVVGGMAGEFAMENAIGVAAMVKADKLQMKMVASNLEEKLDIAVEVGGVEAEMAIIGSLTTPGTTKPLAILDMGAGSTDASIITKSGEISSCHLAGAGNMVTMLIDRELGLGDFDLAEDIKKYPLAKVESLFHIRHEDGSVQFFDTQLDPGIFARIVILKDGEMQPLEIDGNIEKIKNIRREAKKKVFVENGIRALVRISPTSNIRDIDYVVLVGGSALDFEIPQMITDSLAHYGIVAGRGNIRGVEGPRNAVATGLSLSYREG